MRLSSITACLAFTILTSVAVAQSPVAYAYVQEDSTQTGTPLGGSSNVGTSGVLVPMAWDTANHLYALNNQSGKLHIWTVTSKGASEVSGSPYSIPFCGYSLQNSSPNCTQTLIVRSK